MDATSARARIDAIQWYHEFDFGEGLKANSVSAHDHGHRNIWMFSHKHLDAFDFKGKTVLDIGCWDGYWSFHAEKRGAGRVLATDDCTQNWANGEGLRLAKELLKSNIEVNQRVSVYKLDELNQKFDVILLLGVYYHLLDPFYAFSQIRHRCHPGTVVLVEGPIALSLPENTSRTKFEDHAAEWLPMWGALEQILRACYFKVVSKDVMNEEARMAVMNAPRPVVPVSPSPQPGRLGLRWRMSMAAKALAGDRRGVREMYTVIRPAEASTPENPIIDSDRVFFQLKPFEGEEPIHAYKPPFGLDRYDPRFHKAG